jgi:hypothetical protein
MGLFKDCGCGCGGQKQQEKFIISVISGLTFFIVANPETFRLVRRVLGSWIATPTGCPSTLGLLVHTLVFILVVWGMMNIKKEGGCPSKKKSGSVLRIAMYFFSVGLELSSWKVCEYPCVVASSLDTGTELLIQVPHQVAPSGLKSSRLSHVNVPVCNLFEKTVGYVFNVFSHFIRVHTDEVAWECI